jgi:serine/threonine protein kinase
MPELQSGEKQNDTLQHLGVLPPGTMLQSFEVVSVLGHGGFGVTYRAYDTKLHRDVAIKEYLPTALALRHDGLTVLPRSTDLGEDFVWGRERFLDEARILAKLENAPAVVRVIDFLEANGTAYMVMALVKGDTLERLLRRNGMTPEQIEGLVAPLVEGLRQVHANGFLHRDIKPANILLDEVGQPTLIDFGASRAAMADRTTAMTAIFTPGYAAAEQFTSGKQGPWTDIYGLCATFHHAITGKTPPSAFERVLDDAYEPLSQLRPPGFSTGFLAAIDAGLAVRAGDRPQTMDAWQALVGGAPGPLRSSTADATVLVSRPSPETKPPIPAKRRPLLWAGAAAVALAMAMAGGGAYVATQRPSGPDPATIAATEAQKARDSAAASDAARLKAEEDLAKLRSDEEARAKEAADAEQRRKIEEQIRQKIAAEQAQAEQKAAAEAAAKQKAAEAEAAAKRVAEEADKKSAEAAETALHLSTVDRQHLQIALTASGFNTNGSDGAFGPHTRDMIAAWQKSRNLAATGFLTSAQEQALLNENAAVLRKYDDDQKAAESAKTQATAAAPAPAPATPAPRAAPTFSSRVDTDPTGRNYKVLVKSGMDIKITQHGQWKECTQLAVPTAALVTPPANGEVSFRTQMLPHDGCPDPIEFLTVHYRSKPGYVGPDSFSYTRTGASTNSRNRSGGADGVRQVTIDVKP